MLSPPQKPWKWFVLGYCAAGVVSNLVIMPSSFSSLSSVLSGSRYLSVEEEGKSASSSPVLASWGNFTAPPAAFDTMVKIAYNHVFQEIPSFTEQEFNLRTWNNSNNGGLLDADRTMLARIYSEADSVMEYGLGESTFIAGHVGVQRYAGIDSDPVWIANTRDKVPPHFRFYLADIGETGWWGRPKQKLPKAVLNYQLIPLIVEPHPFDVYMVDGRFRFPCLMASFLHASARGEKNRTRTKVIVHDCQRAAYRKADKLFTMEFSGSRLCSFQRKPDTTDEQLLSFWEGGFTDAK